MQSADGSIRGGRELARDICQSENAHKTQTYFCHAWALLIICPSDVYFQVYIEDSLGERIWVDSSHCKNFVDNIQTAFGTKMPPKSMLLQADTGRSAGDLSAGMVHSGFCKSGLLMSETSADWSCCFWSLGSSPHPSTPDEDDSQTELLIAEEKLSPEDEGQVMPRYESYQHKCDSHSVQSVCSDLQHI